MSDLKDIATLCKEIDCLTTEVDTLRKEAFALSAWSCREIDRITAERDEARREVCSLKPFAHHNDGIAKDYAAYRKWDCFKENTDE